MYRRLDIKLGVRLVSATQDKIATAKATARSRVSVKEETTQSSVTAATATAPQEHKKRKRQEDTPEMLDVGSLLKKQKERER